jgi:hypothetical protein
MKKQTWRQRQSKSSLSRKNKSLKASNKFWRNEYKYWLGHHQWFNKDIDVETFKKNLSNFRSWYGRREYQTETAWSPKTSVGIALERIRLSFSKEK